MALAAMPYFFTSFCGKIKRAEMRKGKTIHVTE